MLNDYIWLSDAKFNNINTTNMTEGEQTFTELLGAELYV